MIEETGKYLHIIDLLHLFMVNKTINKAIKSNRKLPQQMLRNLIQQYYNIIDNNDDYDLFFNNQHIRSQTCMNRCDASRENCPYIYPYIFATNNYNNHIHLKPKDISINNLNRTNTNFKINYSILFANNDFVKLNHIFNTNIWFRRIKILMSFAKHIAVNNNLSEKSSTLGRIAINHENIPHLNDDIWQPVRIKYRNGWMQVIPINITKIHIGLTTGRILKTNLNNLYRLFHWQNNINWNKFRIMGGSLYNCLINSKYKKINKETTDIDLFAINIDYSEFLREMAVWIQYLENNSGLTALHRISFAGLVFSFYIWFNTDRYHIKIQFVWLGNYNENTILNKFDFAAIQLSYNPTIDKITHSTAFSDYVANGFNYVYDYSPNSRQFIKRLLKYHKKGVRFIKVPKDTDLMRMEFHMNVILHQDRNHHFDSRIFHVTTNSVTGIHLATSTNVKLFIDGRPTRKAKITIDTIDGYFGTLHLPACCRHGRDTESIFKSINFLIDHTPGS